MVQNTINVENKSAIHYQMKREGSGLSKQMKRSKYKTVPQVNQQSYDSGTHHNKD